MTADNQRVIVIHSREEIPAFASEEEEARFWETHEMSEDLWHSLPRVPDELLPSTRRAIVRSPAPSGPCP